jgi:hypothetical protein
MSKIHNKTKKEWLNYKENETPNKKKSSFCSLMNQLNKIKNYLKNQENEKTSKINSIELTNVV